MKNRFILFFACLFVIIGLQAQTVKPLDIFSQKMNRNVKNIIILPEGYNEKSQTRYPVVYLLHGHGGNETTFTSRTKKSLPEDANRLQVIFVCPDGQNSWYWDSPVNPASQYETYVSKELVEYIDSHYNTIASPKGRAVTGFSMGGHGGLWIGINHPDVFGACGSMSGGVDIRPYPKKWHIEDLLGPYKDNKDLWESHTVITNLSKIEPGTLAIIIDCGTEDFFHQINEELHKAMLYNNIQHDYIVRPGAHKHEYWDNALDYQLEFFMKHFNK
ncbi:alpha/beta hydrolase family protein [Dysgonomonas sp. 25]|uniref:alpha/beta hydrolase n=1 Tax=Dysgonomonas sp. 25 TaxID=2302933 RepID=UPI0013D6604E|nr:alpha/beta hydrolase family protein [Dysgonomonas sp. 25]NDV69837.1 esterase family protein [Dysgonomonas sp. 25]